MRGVGRRAGVRGGGHARAPGLALIDLLARTLEIPLRPRDAAIEPRDAIVVLGAPLRRDRLTPILRERIDAALALWRAGGGRWIVATGGVTGGSARAEAEAMADALRADAGDAVLVEARARTTAENAALTAALLRERGAHTIWVVTQPFHARRATHLMARAGLDAKPWHIADSLQYRDRRRAVRWLVREYVAWVGVALKSASPHG